MVTPLMRPHLFILTPERGKSSLSSDLSIILHILSNASSSTPGAFDHRLKFRKFGLPAEAQLYQDYIRLSVAKYSLDGKTI